MRLPIYVVDAFTASPFSGNPAGVVPLHESIPDDLMARIAIEMKHSETAFLLPEGDGYRLRWFTPAVEVDLCGHATLASAHVLWESGRLHPGSPALFYTRSGKLSASLNGNRIEMDFPAEPAEQVSTPPQIKAICGADFVWCGKNRMDWVVEVDSPATLHQLEPDLATIASLGERGLIVTCRGEGEYDFISRFFAPLFGVLEDPVTGSAHCCLGPYWGERLKKSDLLGYQASKRGGEVGVHLVGDRVVLAGHAVTVLEGTLSC